MPRGALFGFHADRQLLISGEGAARREVAFAGAARTAHAAGRGLVVLAAALDAELIGVAALATAAAVHGIGVEIDAGAVALGAIAGAGRHARAAVTDGRRPGAIVARRTTVLGVRVQIDAVAAHGGEPRAARAAAPIAILVGATRFAAAAAVVGVGRGVHAAIATCGRTRIAGRAGGTLVIVAEGLSRRAVAIEHALATLTILHVADGPGGPAIPVELALDALLGQIGAEGRVASTIRIALAPDAGTRAGIADGSVTLTIARVLTGGAALVILGKARLSGRAVPIVAAFFALTADARRVGRAAIGVQRTLDTAQVLVAAVPALDPVHHASAAGSTGARGKGVG